LIQVEDLPLSWFDRPQYRPRIRRPDGGESWFALSEAIPRETAVPLASPREPAAGRRALRRTFEETYDSWGLRRSAEALRALEAVESPGTALVVTGQQPGFLASPLYAIYKALGAIAAARRIERDTGRPAVPVFWVAGDDHDLDEVRSGVFPATGGGEATFSYPGPSDRRPLSSHLVEGEAAAVIEAAALELSRRRNGEEAARLARLYVGRNLASGFAAILEDLLGGEGLLVVDPARLRPMARAVIRKVIESPEAVLEAIEEGRGEVRERGMEPLVAARLPLFILEEGRRMHLTTAGGGGSLRIDGEGGKELSKEGLLDLLEKSPELFSHGALLRPIVQEHVLPSVLSIGGPAEVGYFAQIGPLARLLGSPAPRIALRPGATLVDGKAARFAREAGLERIASAPRPEDLLEPSEEPPAIRAARELAGKAEEALARAARDHASPAKAGRLEARGREIAEDMRRLVDRIHREEANAAKGASDARKLWDQIFPGGELQERRWTALHFVAKHGREWIGGLLRAIEAEPLGTAHRWVTFEG